MEMKIHVESPAEIEGVDAGEYSGVYAGGSFCPETLIAPEQLREYAAAARGRGLSLHVSTPFLPESHYARAMSLAETIAAEAPDAELIVNDLGFMSDIAARFPGIRLSAGRILAMQKTDPRVIDVIDGFFSPDERDRKRRDFAHVSTGNPLFVNFLKGFGVGRMEIQWPKHGVEITDFDFRYTLHLPYVFVSASRYCPPLERHVRSGRVAGVYPCKKHCLQQSYRLRPRGEAFELLFRGNTVYYETGAAEGLPTQIDRIVDHRHPS